MQRAFSLVELSIVLVILGLLTGGILAGKSLIRAAELRSIPADAQKYTTAIYTFKDKYQALPGDFRDATRFWSRSTSDAWCVTNSAAAVTTPGVCDGDGDGILEATGTAATSAELWQIWRHLALAGLIEGEYTGLAGTASYADTDVGSNVPASKFSQTGFGAWPVAQTAAATTTFGGTGTVGWWGNQTVPAGSNALTIGSSSSAGYPAAAFLKADEAWSIDTKMDDGKPAAGQVIAPGCVSYATGCMIDGAGAAPTADCNTFALTAQYNITNTAVACGMLFKLR